MKTLGIVAISAVGLLAVYTLVVFGREMYVQATQLPRVEEELGLSLETPIVDGREVIQFGNVSEDGAAYQAGVREGDILKASSLGVFAKGYLEDGSFSFTVLRNREEILITIQ